MSSPVDLNSQGRDQPAQWFVRALSAVGGLLVLLVAALFTLGAALLAPVGMFGARMLARRRERAPTWIASWFGACIASSIALVVALVVLISLMPPDTLRQVQAAVDSARVEARAHPTPWVERMRKANPNPAAEAIANSPIVLTVSTAVGASLGVVLFGVIAGSAGWLGTWLLVFAYRGHVRPN